MGGITYPSVYLQSFEPKSEQKHHQLNDQNVSPARKLGAHRATRPGNKNGIALWTHTYLASLLLAQVLPRRGGSKWHCRLIAGHDPCFTNIRIVCFTGRGVG